MKKILTDINIDRMIKKMAHEIMEEIDDFNEVVVIGILQGGRVLAQRLASVMAQELSRIIPVGFVDVTFYRDDIHRGTLKAACESTIAFDINDKHVILVDDVLFSGRTVRAALNALNDFGRPSHIKLAVLIDRGNRELPINADFVGKKMTPTKTANITVQFSDQKMDDVIIIEE